jgi:predicted ArsR family transcriptional regulator
MDRRPPKVISAQQLATKGILGEPRGRVLTELCGHPRTATELAERIGTSSNAVRAHLDALREAGLVDFTVERRGVGKPTHVYALTAAAEYVLSSAYAPALRAILDTLRTRLNGDLAAWLREAGATLAQQQRPPSPKRQSLASALELLRGLGAVVSTERDGGDDIVHSACCPLGAITRTVPETCKLLEGMLAAALPSRRVRERCERGEHSRCAFAISRSARTGERSA